MAGREPPGRPPRVCSAAVGRDLRGAGSRHIPKVLAAEGGERPQGAKSNEKAFHQR